jgi:RNA polymerase-interacting CarD/CdnL/TRCF family regulator
LQALSEIAKILSELLSGSQVDFLALTSIVIGIFIYVFLSEPIKELRERLLRAKSLKKEVEHLRTEIVTAFRREDESKERAAAYRELLEAAVIAKNEALWRELIKERRIKELELELARLMIAAAEHSRRPSECLGFYEI